MKCFRNFITFRKYNKYFGFRKTWHLSIILVHYKNAEIKYLLSILNRIAD